MSESSPSLPRNAPRIPQELIDIAIDLLHDDHTTLKNCSLISSSTLHICRKFLFRRIIIDIFDLPTKNGAIYLDKFARFWRESPHLVPYVEEFHVKYIPQSTLRHLPGVLEPFRDHKLRRFTLEALTSFSNLELEGSLESLLNNSVGELTHLRMGELRDVPRDLFGRFDKLKTLVLGANLALVPLDPEALEVGQTEDETVEGADESTDEQLDNILATATTVNGDLIKDQTTDGVDDTMQITKPLEALHLLTDVPDDTMNFLVSPEFSLDLTSLRRLTILMATSLRVESPARHVLFQKVAPSLEYFAYEPSILTGMHLGQPSILDLQTMPNLRHLVLYIQQCNADVNFIPWLNDLLSAIPTVNSLVDITLAITFLDIPSLNMMESQGWHRLDEILASFENLKRCRFICLTHAPKFGLVEDRLQSSMKRLVENGILGIHKTSAASYYPSDNTFEDFDLCRDRWA